MPIPPSGRRRDTAHVERRSGVAHRREESSTKTERARVPHAPPTPPPRLPRMIPLPDVRQATGYTCGTASLLSILSYYGWKGDDPNEKDFAKELGTTWQNGTEPEDIAKMSNHLGVRAEIRNHMSLDDVIAHVKRGEPVMVAYQAYPEEGSSFPDKRPWSEDWRDGHWSIVIGVDSENVYLEDPSMLGKRGFIPRAEFLERWHDTDRKNRPVYEHLGIVFSCDTPASERNEVIVKKVAYVP